MDIHKISYDKSINNEELFTQAKLGDSVAKELLFKNNVPFIRRLAKKFKRKGSSEDFEELMSIGFLALTRSYNSYDPDRGCKFITLAGIAIWNAFSNNATNMTKTKFTKYMTIRIDEIDNDTEEDMHDIIPNDYVSGEHEYLYENSRLLEIEKVFNKVANDREKEVFVKHYKQNISLADIAREWNQSRAAASYIHRSCIKKIQDLLKDQQLA